MPVIQPPTINTNTGEKFAYSASYQTREGRLLRIVGHSEGAVADFLSNVQAVDSNDEIQLRTFGEKLNIINSVPMKGRLPSLLTKASFSSLLRHLGQSRQGNEHHCIQCDCPITPGKPGRRCRESCGFDDYLGETCECETCREFKLPLTHCPACGTEYVVAETDPGFQPTDTGNFTGESHSHS